MKPVNALVKVSGRLRSDHRALAKAVDDLNDREYRVLQILRIDGSKNYLVLAEYVGSGVADQPPTYTDESPELVYDKNGVPGV